MALHLHLHLHPHFLSPKLDTSKNLILCTSSNGFPKPLALFKPTSSPSRSRSRFLCSSSSSSSKDSSNDSILRFVCFNSKIFIQSFKFFFMFCLVAEKICMTQKIFWIRNLIQIFFFYSNFCIIEGPETVQDFVQMQLREIQDNIRSRRNKIFLLMEEVKFFFFFLMEFFNLVCKNSSTTTFVTTVKLWLLWRKNSGSLWKCESDRYSLLCKIVVVKVATFSL